LTATSSPPTKEAVWRIDPSRTTAWRMWDGEVVVYDDVSGDTLKLDSIMTVIFLRLLETPSRSPDLVSHLARELDVDDDPKLRQLTELGLSRLAGCGLVIAAPEPVPVPRPV